MGGKSPVQCAGGLSRGSPGLHRRGPPTAGVRGASAPGEPPANVPRQHGDLRT